MPDVIVIGDVDTDIFLKIPHMPGHDEGVLAEAVYERAGGKGANAACMLSRLGTSSGMLAFCGDDRYGEIARQSLDRHGVDISHLRIIPGGKTYNCYMLLDPSGEKAIIVVLSDIIYPTPEYQRECAGYITSARHVHAVGLNPPKVEEGLRIARFAGLSTSVDLDSVHTGLDACRGLIESSTVLFVNQRGARKLFPDLDLRQIAVQLQSMGPQIAVVTRGGEGSIAADGHQVIETAAFKLDVKDTTGAGDCFCGAFVHAFLGGAKLVECLRFASAAAALSTLAFGGQEALPTEFEVKELLNCQSAGR